LVKSCKVKELGYLKRKVQGSENNPLKHPKRWKASKPRKINNNFDTRKFGGDRI
jgi:hypothetical protein